MKRRKLISSYLPFRNTSPLPVPDQSDHDNTTLAEANATRQRIVSKRFSALAEPHSTHKENSIVADTGSGINDTVHPTGHVTYLPAAETTPPPTQYTFAFSHAHSGPASRFKPTSVCNTPQKLFAQAEKAGIANKSTTILRLFVQGPEVESVIRGDADDLTAFLQSLGSGAVKHPEIVVLADSEDA